MRQDSKGLDALKVRNLTMFALSPGGADTAEYLNKKPCGLSINCPFAFNVDKQAGNTIIIYN